MASPSPAEVDDQVPVKKLPTEVIVTLSDCDELDVLVYTTVIAAEGGTVKTPVVSRNSTTNWAELPCSILNGPLKKVISVLLPLSDLTHFRSR